MRTFPSFLATVLLNTVLLNTALLIQACSPATPDVTALPSLPAVPSSTATPGLVAATPTAVPSPTATATALPCDPLVEPYCLVDGHFLLAYPLAGVYPDPGYLYGTTQNGLRDPHHGLDFDAASGTPVLAAAAGEVIFAGRASESHRYGPPLWSDRGFYGNLILLQHDLPGVEGPFFTLYGHLSGVDVQPGQVVRAGERIGAVGATGSAIGSHLHFEVRQGGDTYADNRNPLLWLPPPPERGVLLGRMLDSRGQPLYRDAELQRLQSDPGVECSLSLPRDPAGARYALQAYDRRNDGKFPVGLDPLWQETFVLGNLPPGCYRLAALGGLFERAVRIEAGRLTLVTFQVE